MYNTQFHTLSHANVIFGAKESPEWYTMYINIHFGMKGALKSEENSSKFYITFDNFSRFLKMRNQSMAIVAP